MGIRVLLLDRDTPALERLAGELEQAGLEVLVAHYPEEVSFFLKTSEARRLAAAVCDVMAFRGDQNLIEAFRAWRQDLAGLALFLSFKADNPTEAERARRVPSVLTAGYLKRPLESAPLVEALVALGRRPAARS
jgi:DNA-binding response OmpR family regulator